MTPPHGEHQEPYGQKFPPPAGYGAVPGYGAPGYGMPGYGAVGPPPDNNLVWAILTTALCCLPFGIVAIVKSGQVNQLWMQGRFDEARRAADQAKQWCIWGVVGAVVAAVVAIIGYVVFFALVAVNVETG